MSINESPLQYQAAQFRVALLLKQYKFGAASAAKYLGKSRGLVQSWMQIGNKHYLAREKIKLKSFEKIVKNLRRTITKENIEYFLAMRLLELNLPVAYISKIMDLPTSTVRSWHFGKVPCEIKKFFYDPKLVDREFNKLLKFLKAETTRNNMEYFLAIRLAENVRKNLGRRRIGGRIISHILSRHFGHIEPIPEKTISCWIDGKRKPWDAFSVLADEHLIYREYNRIVDEQTYEHLTYHLSMILFDQYEWNYSKISKVLNINKELVRGWVKKGRGNPVAKTLVNHSIVESEVKKYFNPEDSQLNIVESNHGLKINEKVQKNGVSGELKENQNTTNHKIDEFNKDLEQELIYHLETIPTGVTSPKVLKSILIDYSEVTLEEIEKVLHQSKEIIRSRDTGKWILKRFEDNDFDSTIDDDLAKIDCKCTKDDEVICTD
jgi:hypothetical protein